MGKKLQTIYELLSEYTEEEINNALSSLDNDEQNIIVGRYGVDLHNPKTSLTFTKEERIKFYGAVIPKLKKILSRKKINLDELMDTDVLSLFNIEEKAKLNTDIRTKLLGLIKQGKTNNEICEELNISREDLYNLLLELKNRGTVLLRKYYSDGTIKYRGARDYSDLNLATCIPKERSIITDTNEQKMKFLVVSDFHFGNSCQRVDLVNRAYEYCAKNGINYIICCGDLIDGTYTRGEQVISDTYEQIEFFIKNYPFDKNILTLGVIGDHDSSALFDNALNIIETCNNYRHDVILGARNMVLNLKNDKILLFHLKNTKSLNKLGAPLVLQGHFHAYSTYVEDGALNIDVPTLSDLTNSLPTALEMSISFEKGYIKDLCVKQILFGEKDMTLNEMLLDLLAGRDVKNVPLLNVEKYKIEPNEQKKKTLA